VPLIAIGFAVPFWMHGHHHPRASLAKNESANYAALRQRHAPPPASEKVARLTSDLIAAQDAPAVEPPAVSAATESETSADIELASASPGEKTSQSAAPQYAVSEDQTVDEARMESELVPVLEPTLGRPMQPYDLMVRLDRQAVQLDLHAEKGAVQELLMTHPAVSGRQTLVDVLARHSDLAGLPIRGESVCQVDRTVATAMQAVSSKIRAIEQKSRRVAIVIVNDSESFSHSHEAQHEQALLQLLEREATGNGDSAAVSPSTLVQMLQVESDIVRGQLVWKLRFTKGPDASVALAERALFDLSDTVRRAAFEALRDRPAAEYQDRLVEGLRYPWPPVADHAAEALAEIGDTTAIGRIAALVGEPDPTLPRLNDEKTWVVKELVRVNHLRNCLLCHAPSHSGSDLVRGLVPTPGKPLPVVYYQSHTGNFVRADTIYLKQDFSVMHRVADHGPWPEEQRFDYFVRTRELTPDEVAVLPPRDPVCHSPYPQRESVLYVLHRLEKKARERAEPEKITRN
jgi:hypothetical protein